MATGRIEALEAQVVRLYREEGLSTRRIADAVGVDRGRVCRILKREGVHVTPRGAGRKRPLRVNDSISESALRYLYVNLQMSSVEIGRALGISDRFLRSRLRHWGIVSRSKGQWNRIDRDDVAREDLMRLYVEKEWAASEVGDELGVSRNIVLRSAHSSGIPVRSGGSIRPSESYDILLLEALYDDDDVSKVLVRHHIPVVREPGPIWVRFPMEVELTGQLLEDLYLDCGVSSFHIELLTGVPVPTVLRRLEEFGIERRSRGGRSPFMRRWHDKRKQNNEESRRISCD